MVSLSQVGVFDCPAFTKTSYASEFTLPERQDTTRYHNYVSFVSSTEDKLVPRCFPHFALHVSPHRILDYERSALGFGPTGAEYVKTEKSEPKESGAEVTEASENEEDSKNILGTASCESELEGFEKQRNERDFSEIQNEDSRIPENMAPRQKFDIPKHVLDEVTANIYKSTARRASEECPIPLPQRPPASPCIIGNNEDRELYHSIYRRTGTWKSNVVPETWERAQERPLYEDPKAKQYRTCRLRFSKSKTRLLSKRLPRANEVAPTKVEGAELILPTPIQHIRPSPGYAGFFPRLPVVPSSPRDPRLMLSTTAATYRCIESTQSHTPGSENRRQFSVVCKDNFTSSIFTCNLKGVCNAQTCHHADFFCFKKPITFAKYRKPPYITEPPEYKPPPPNISPPHSLTRVLFRI